LNTDADGMPLLAHMGQQERQARLPELRRSIARFSRNLVDATWRSALQQVLAQRLSETPPGRTGAAR
jgi:hypothetical protein